LTFPREIPSANENSIYEQANGHRADESPLRRRRRHTMKKQIERFSPHQNAKVFAVLMTVSSMVFVVPFMLMASAFGPKDSAPPAFFFLAFPVAYLVFGYLSVVIGCWLYNFMFRFIGGIEFEAREAED
jgi:hypothetical protein